MDPNFDKSEPNYDWRQSIASKIMEGVGKVAEVDRVYVFEYVQNESEKLMRYTKEWTADGVAPQMERLGKDALRGPPNGKIDRTFRFCR
jgi:hypothetical protein